MEGVFRHTLNFYYPAILYMDIEAAKVVTHVTNGLYDRGFPLILLYSFQYTAIGLHINRDFTCQFLAWDCSDRRSMI